MDPNTTTPANDEEEFTVVNRHKKKQPQKKFNKFNNNNNNNKTPRHNQLSRPNSGNVNNNNNNNRPQQPRSVQQHGENKKRFPMSRLNPQHQNQSTTTTTSSTEKPESLATPPRSRSATLSSATSSYYSSDDDEEDDEEEDYEHSCSEEGDGTSCSHHHKKHRKHLIDRDAMMSSPVPPFYLPILLVCPFSDCPPESCVPFTHPNTALNHLKTVHNMSIYKSAEVMQFLEKYLTVKARLVDEFGLESIATLSDKPGSDGNYLYVLGSEFDESDKQLRQRLQREKLEEILAIQEKERQEDSQRPRQCLFCKLVCPNRFTLFKHMFNEHGFNIGLPDNLVEVNEFLDILQSKLASLQCLFCEKNFKSAAVLRKHMRKKKHFKINPHNHLYDRFYVVNYIELGKNWEELDTEDEASIAPSSAPPSAPSSPAAHRLNPTPNADSDSSLSRPGTPSRKTLTNKDEAEWSDWIDPVDSPTMCLFETTTILPTPIAVLEHMKTAHGFDFTTIRKTHHMDFYDCIKFINYVRRRVSEGMCFGCEFTVSNELIDAFEREKSLLEHMHSEKCFNKIASKNAEIEVDADGVEKQGSGDVWWDTKYLFPTFENDPLLSGFEGIEEEEGQTVEIVKQVVMEPELKLKDLEIKE